MTGARFRLAKRGVHDTDARAHQIRILSGVAGHLCSALEALSRSDCEWYDEGRPLGY